MMSFFQSHYEKIILASLLVIFAVLLVWQVNFLQAVQNQKVDAIINKEEPKSDQSPYDFSQPKFQDSFIFLDRVSWHPEPKVNELPHPKTDLFSSFNLSVCPFCYNLIPSAYFPELGSSDVNRCPIEYCRKELKARQKKVERKDQDIDLTASANNDKNTNGVPDDWEKENDVYSESSGAIDDDPDQDRFSTYAEYVLRTNPMDPKSHPRYIDYTSIRRLGRTRITDFYYRGLAATGVTDKTKLEFNIEHKEPGWRSTRTKVKKLGEKFKHKAWTFEIVDVTPDDPESPGQGTIIFVRRDGFEEKIKCDPNKAVYDPVETVDLWSIWSAPSRKPIQCQVGKTFRLGDSRTGIEEYTLVSATPESAVVVNAKGEKFVLKKNTKQPIIERRTQNSGTDSEPGVSEHDNGPQPLDVEPSSSPRRRRSPRGRSR